MNHAHDQQPSVTERHAEGTNQAHLSETLWFNTALSEVLRLENLLQGHHADLQILGNRLTSFDSSAIAVLLHLRREATSRGIKLSVNSKPPSLQSLMRIYGVHELFVDNLSGEKP